MPFVAVHVIGTQSCDVRVLFVVIQKQSTTLSSAFLLVLSPLVGIVLALQPNPALIVDVRGSSVVC